MKTITQILLLCLLIATGASCQEARTVKVQVTEESGTPIEDAHVSVWYMGFRPGESKEVAGNTNKKGVFLAKGVPLLRMEAFISKEGYYKSESGRLSRKKDHAITLVLRRIKNPIPLYAKRYRGKLPGLNNKYGFDLRKGDWVAPFGKGKQIDLFFAANIVRDRESKLAGKITISFPDEKEGAAKVTTQNGYLPQSQLIMPNQAFAAGYISKISRIESGYENISKPFKTSYFFRTRAQKKDSGKYIFNYSKFAKGFDFMMGGGRFLEEPYRNKYPKEYAMVEFTYYFNPTPNDRNLEFDPTRNLFENLDSIERVNEP